MRDTTKVQIVRERDLYLPKSTSLQLTLRGTSQYGEDIYVLTAVVNGGSEAEAQYLMAKVQDRVGRVLGAPETS